MYRQLKNGRWWKDGKFVKESDVPEAEKSIAKRQCPFCGEHGDRQRLINGMMVYLDDGCYYSQTYGSIVGKLREKGLIDVQQTQSVGSPT
jgi:hypothetical protein